MSSDDDDEDEAVVMTSRDFSRVSTLEGGLSRISTLELGETVSSTPDPTPRAPPLVVIIHYLRFNGDASFFVTGKVQQVVIL